MPSPPDTYTFHVSKPGYLNNIKVITITAVTHTVTNFSLTPLLSAEELTIALTWGATPNDLDAHLWLDSNTPYHLYEGRPGNLNDCPYALLELTDDDGFGPETITLAPAFADISDTFIYAVHSPSGSFAGSQPQVQIFDSSGLLTTITPPIDDDGEWWVVAAAGLNIDPIAIVEVNDFLPFSPEPYPDTGSGCGLP